MTSVFLFSMGACIGSFLNVCIWRLPKGEPVTWSRSRCPRCRHPIAWYDNIPVLGYLMLAGRCRRCGGGISPRYPFVELAAGALLAALSRRWGIQGPWFAVSFAASSAFIVVAFIDWDTFLIPDVLSLGLLAGGLAGALFNPYFPGGLLRHIGASACGSAAGFVVCWATAEAGAAIFKKEAMGDGDVKLLAAIGAWIGASGAVDALLMACLLGAMYSLPLLAARRLRRQDAIPFGPFLSAAAIVEFFWRLPFFRTMLRLMDMSQMIGPG